MKSRKRILAESACAIDRVLALASKSKLSSAPPVSSAPANRPGTAIGITMAKKRKRTDDAAEQEEGDTPQWELSDDVTQRILAAKRNMRPEFTKKEWSKHGFARALSLDVEAARARDTTAR